MPRKTDLLKSLSAAELKSMLTAKTKIEELETKRDSLAKELGRVDKELAKLYASAGSTSPTRKKRAKKKVAKKTAKKRVAKKATARAAAAKTSSRKKTAKKPVAKKKTTMRGPTVESVVVDLIQKNGGKMAFQDILATIQKKKLVKSKAKDFDNVLRRTISGSEKIKRASRGVYTT